MVMEEGGRNYSSEHVESHTAITGLTVCFPPWLLLSRHPAAIAASGAGRTPVSLAFTNPRTEQRWGQGEPGVRFTQRAFYKKITSKAGPGTSGYHEAQTDDRQSLCLTLSSTRLVPHSLSLSRSPGFFRRLSAPDECMLKILHHYLSKPFKFQQRLSNSPPDKRV